VYQQETIISDSDVPSNVTKACEAAAARDPRKFPFGVYAGDSWAGGAYMFAWFKDLTGLIHFLTDLAPGVYIDPKSETDEYLQCRTQLRELLAAVDRVDQFDEALINKLNEEVSDQTIAWIGTLDNLGSSKAEWCRELRESFREHDTEDGEDPSDGPITDDELEDFLEMLTEYGF
jgi:hypothetical protein